jgi:dynamin 1-like protein
MRDFYSTKNVKAVIDAADGYQPHLVGWLHYRLRV